MQEGARTDCVGEGIARPFQGQGNEAWSGQGPVCPAHVLNTKPLIATFYIGYTKAKLRLPAIATMSDADLEEVLFRKCLRAELCRLIYCRFDAHVCSNCSNRAVGAVMEEKAQTKIRRGTIPSSILSPPPPFNMFSLGNERPTRRPPYSPKSLLPKPPTA